ncbi:YgaP family membrane protein [Meridianimarinicoccus aquatilis]|uniref:DUF2892 domain-containing protein n=1 Tax=Meridianimarinicoccus aquatilis TaxID=2552766 RepID=A0A4R6B394_9RHOB|nr:DUF2892 domain-containing protein [Fluviibacterium aquatile]QIE42337.1 DUF2892 domain-containing protein [Rhodobacteraceae bacterium SC52]TDL91267.1 DUF2892 domain-containing protein [Fluviibacterium aquatile]
MTPNVGQTDRIIRGAAGVALVLLSVFSGMPLFDGSLVKWIAVLVGLVLLATSSVAFCPGYALFGIKTCKDC